ncbi:MAG: FAD-linked oxidase C-terminal domain-containing protein [Blastochloris sp.]|nr:FAD-linked oxidase C-terminal domain-containing protein [Blastochloris sp.]
MKTAHSLGSKKAIWLPALNKLLPNKVSTTEAILHEHGGDAWFAHSMPQAVVIPESTADVQKLMRFCAKRKIPVTPRGSGRGYVGGCVPVQGGISLSLKKMNRILEISKEDSLAVVEPGVITGDIQSLVKAQGLYYPPDPASAAESSIGGNIATNAGGPRCLKYGVTRNYIIGLHVVLANGDLVKVGGRTQKNKLGFNLTDLFIGSEGMLGIVTQATLRLLPHPPARALIVASFAHATGAAMAVQKILSAGFLPSALEIADSFTLEAARTYSTAVPLGKALLMVEIDGQISSVKSEEKSLVTLLRQLKALSTQTSHDPKGMEKLWAIRKAFSYSLRATGLTKLNEDVVVPRGKLLQLFQLTKTLQKKYKIAVASFGHAGDGNIHVNLMVPPQDAQSPHVAAALAELFHTVLSWGGTITGEHGVGLAKKPWWNAATTPELRSLHHCIKTALDPLALLNPGKFLD